MQVILLVAGRGSRMGQLTKDIHKSLLPLGNGDTFLSRVLHQLNEYKISKLVVVTGYKSEDIKQSLCQYQINYEVIENEKYKEDTNIYSMKLALDAISLDEPVIIIEGDTFIDDIALHKIYNQSRSQKSIYFTRGRFNKHQDGGILRVGSDGWINSILIVDKFKQMYIGFDKLLGLMTVSPNELPVFKDYINQYSKQSLKNYYLKPWIDHLTALPAKSFDLSEHIVTSVNTAAEYHDFVNEFQLRTNCEIDIEYLDINSLVPIEDFLLDRISILENQIRELGRWTKPIIIEKNHRLILDGHHRCVVAKRLGLKKIPAVLVNYNQVDLWSLREDEVVDAQTVVRRAKAQLIYPNKTVKHDFKFSAPKIDIAIEYLLS